ncbi:hypothetical protein BIV25_01180 [Streptomyces sp. MUSC 14]|uniref:hypothetical protein n=1 Tax=Streptomyces sp. MUSC 14 TaxID=1354889 RepID=UPI0008F5855A|nr:hypothetical protein [Streptomyces sp. MUSC 14]OIK02847.1 hypothetical protein BIV25_01180 [Streptomyces sp. MUSC 14]
MITPRLTESFINLAPSALTALTGAPWWGIALPILVRPVIQNFPQHILTLVQARNEARRGRQEDRLLDQIPRRHAFQALAHIRQAQSDNAPRTPPESADPPTQQQPDTGTPATPT